MSASDKTKLDGIEEGANNYSLPLADSSTRGGIKVGYTQDGQKYPVQLSSEKAYVEVPWQDTKNSAGTMNRANKKLYIVGAETQATNPTTNSNANVYIGTDNCLYSNGTKVLTAHQDISGKADKATTVTNVAYDSVNKKITKTINGTTTDVVNVENGATANVVSDSLTDTSTTNALSANQGRVLRGLIANSNVYADTVDKLKDAVAEGDTATFVRVANSVMNALFGVNRQGMAMCFDYSTGYIEIIAWDTYAVVYGCSLTKADNSVLDPWSSNDFLTKGGITWGAIAGQ
jgi:hypothetical protein